jgi:hypothetical protein
MTAPLTWKEMLRCPVPAVAVGQTWRTPDGSRLYIARAAGPGRWDIEIHGEPGMDMPGQTESWIRRIGRLEGFDRRSPAACACDAWFGSAVVNPEVMEAVVALLCQIGWDGQGEAPPMRAFQRGRCTLVPPNGWVIRYAPGRATANLARLLIEPGSKVRWRGGGGGSSPYDEPESWGLPFDVGDQ